MTRKFNTEHTPAGELLNKMHNLQVRVDLVRFEHPKRRRCGQQAARLLLNWALWGHDPKRNVTTCRVCKGRGELQFFVLVCCGFCNGTGKALKL